MKRYIPILIGMAAAISLTGCGGVKPALLDAGSASAGQQPKEEAAAHQYSGKISGLDEVQIVSKVSGRVEKVLKDIGDSVSPGDELIVLERTDLEAQLASAKSDLAVAGAKYDDMIKGSRAEDIRSAQAAYEAAMARYQDLKNGARQEQINTLKDAEAAAKAAYETAQNKFEREKSLYDAGATSKQSFEDAQNEFNQAQAKYTSAQSELKMAVDGPTEEALKAAGATAEQAKAVAEKVKNGATAEEKEQAKAAVEKAQAIVNLNQYSLDNGTLKSPIKGSVAAKNISVGEIAAPGVSIMTVVNTDQVYVSIEVPESELKDIKLSQSVDVQIDSLGKNVKGSVTNISPKTNPGTNKFLVKILIDNPDHSLRSGMTGIVKL